MSIRSKLMGPFTSNGGKLQLIGALSGTLLLTLFGYLGRYAYYGQRYSSAKAAAGNWTQLKACKPNDPVYPEYGCYLVITVSGVSVSTCKARRLTAESSAYGVKVLIARTDDNALRANLYYQQDKGQGKWQQTPLDSSWWDNLQIHTIPIANPGDKFYAEVQFADNQKQLWDAVVDTRAYFPVGIDNITDC